MENIKRISETVVKIDGWFYQKTEEPKSKFKVGDLVYHTNPPHMKGMDKVFMVCDRVVTMDFGRYRIYDGRDWYEEGYCRHATEDEINSFKNNVYPCTIAKF